MPATQHDVVIWLTGAAYDLLFDLSRAVVVALADITTVATEMVGWPYHRDLDLTGFIDGTENPTLVDAMSIVAIPAGSPGEGSSVLLLQQWEHDAINWEALPVATQEQIIGRRKLDSAELDPKPPASHVARTDQDRLGKIFRRNIAYGTLTRHGTIFVGFCADQRVLAAMLESMVGIGGAAGRADGGDPPADRRVLRDPVGRCAVRVRDRGAALTAGPTHGPTGTNPPWPVVRGAAGGPGGRSGPTVEP